MTVGLCTIISLGDMGVVTYVFETFELALAQCRENEKGVSGHIDRMPQRVGKSGLREAMTRYPGHLQLAVVQEVEVGTAVLPVTL